MQNWLSYYYVKSLIHSEWRHCRRMAKWNTSTLLGNHFCIVNSSFNFKEPIFWLFITSSIGLSISSRLANRKSLCKLHKRWCNMYIAVNFHNHQRTQQSLDKIFYYNLWRLTNFYCFLYIFSRRIMENMSSLFLILFSL